jgi:hypothetical protein
MLTSAITLKKCFEKGMCHIEHTYFTSQGLRTYRQVYTAVIMYHFILSDTKYCKDSGQFYSVFCLFHWDL